MKLYHGSPTRIRGVFRVSDRDISVEIGPGLYLTDARERAESFARETGSSGFIYAITADPEEDLDREFPEEARIETFVENYIGHWGMAENGVSVDSVLEWLYADLENAENEREYLPRLYLGLWSNLTFKNQSESEEFMIAFSSFFRINLIQHPTRDDEYVLINLIKFDLEEVATRPV